MEKKVEEKMKKGLATEILTVIIIVIVIAFAYLLLTGRVDLSGVLPT